MAAGVPEPVLWKNPPIPHAKKAPPALAAIKPPPPGPSGGATEEPNRQELVALVFSVLTERSRSASTNMVGEDRIQTLERLTYLMENLHQLDLSQVAAEIGVRSFEVNSGRPIRVHPKTGQLSPATNTRLAEFTEIQPKT